MPAPAPRHRYRAPVMKSALTPLTMPSSPDGWGDWLGERCGAQLARARDLVRAIKDAPPTDSVRLLTDWNEVSIALNNACLLYTSPSPRDRQKSRMPSSA